MRISFVSLALLPLLCLNAFGQNATSSGPKTPVASAPPPNSSTQNLASTTTDYSAEPAVIEHVDTVYSMNADGTGWRQATMAVRIQSEAAVKQLGVLIISYAGNSEHVEISYARIRRPDGTVVDTPAADAIDMPSEVTRAAPFYSDLKQLELPIRSLAVGETLEWQVKVVQTKAEVPGQFWGQQTFDDNTVALSESLELHVPGNMYVNVWSPTLKPTETVTGQERVFRWVTSQTKPTVGKEADAERELRKKQVWTADEEQDAKEGKRPTVAWSTFKSWEAVGAWYRELEGDRILPDATVKAEVAELTANKTTEEEKVRAVYGYVATQIRYVGVDFGVGRYQPHTAGEVLQNQYGDCKDKVTLLAAMLNTLGLQPDAVLVGAGVRFNQAVPSPASFNHVITRVFVDGKQVWLDATAEVAPYRVLIYTIRDKNALVVPQEGAASIERTPAALPFPAFETFHAVGTLDKQGISNSKIVWTLRGDDELALRSVFRQISPAQYNQFVQRFSQGIGYAGTTSNAEVKNLENTSAPFQFSYDYKREKAGDWANYRIIPQFAPVGMPMVNESDPPVRAILLGTPRVETSTAEMKLPDGLGVVLPDPVHAKSAYATYDETFRFDKGTLHAERRVEILKQTVPVADWKSYKTWADAAGLGKETYIQLTSTTGEPTGANESGPPKASTFGNPEAAKLVSAAYSALQRHDLDAAQSSLDQATSVNPTQYGLWAQYGYLAALRGNAQESADDYKKELSFHPSNTQIYQFLAPTYIRLRQMDNAIDSLRKWAAADPKNPAPSIGLVGLLMEQDHPAEAAAAGEAALARLPDDPKNESLRFMTGRAQFRAGMRDKAKATLAALLQTTKNPGMMNDCAYELADAGEELPLAESKTRTALEQMNTESESWTLQTDPEVFLAKTRLLAATWDTMGWILYREGRLQESLSYLQPAWKNRQTPAIAEHLGDVEAARGQKNAALTMYELGLASISHYNGLGRKQTKPGAEELKLRGRIDSLRKSGAKPLPGVPRQVLQNMRTFSLGTAHGMAGSAQYWLLLSGGGVGQAKTIGSEDVPGGIARVKTINLKGYWPSGSNAKLVRKGIFFCGLGGCQLVLEP